MDRQCSGNKDPTSKKAEDRPCRCSPVAEAAVGKSLPTNLGTESGESGSTAVAVAPASISSAADQDHESAAGHCHERRETLEEETASGVHAG